LRTGEVVDLNAKGPGSSKVDLYDLSDPVDVLAKFSEKWVDKTLEIKEWKEKVEKLNELVKDSSVPKITPGNCSYILAFLKRLLNDSNQNVVICGVKIAGNFAKGMRKGFKVCIKIIN
jgi:hypothetical protein